MPLLTSVILIISAVAKRGSVTSAKSQHAPAVSAALGATGITQTLAPELAALSKGGAWGAVYDALKGPIMARAAELQSGVASGTSGKKTEIVAPAVSVDLARCLDNMARCAEVCNHRGCRGQEAFPHIGMGVVFRGRDVVLTGQHILRLAYVCV